MTTGTVTGAISSAVLVGVVALWTSFTKPDDAKPVRPQAAMPTLVTVAGTWTEPCKVAHTVTRDIGRLYEGRVRVTTVRADRDKIRADELDVRVVPTAIVYDERGKEIGRLEGAVTEVQVRTLLTLAGVALPK